MLIGWSLYKYEGQWHEESLSEASLLDTSLVIELIEMAIRSR